MVVVETSHIWFKAVVVAQLAFIPSEAAHLVDVFAEIDIGFLGDGVPHIGIDV